MENYDVLVIGGGPGGCTAALEAAGRGRRVALFEPGQIGGTCLNRGCIPTKALLHAAALFYQAQAAAGWGVFTQPRCDMQRLRCRVAEITAQLRIGLEERLAKAKVTVVSHPALLCAPGCVQAKGQTYCAPHVVLATGSQPFLPPFAQAGMDGVLTSDALLAQLPDAESLVIIGGGVIGAEIAQAYHWLGCRVTLLEAQPCLLPGYDREISQSLAQLYQKRGITVAAGACVQELVPQPTGVLCRYTDKTGQSRAVQAAYILVSTGRRPCTQSLCTPHVAAALGMQNGYVPVNACQQTALPGVWAVGDIVLGGVQLAHVAEAQARNAVHAICSASADVAGELPKQLSVVPACVFTQPEIATAGFTAQEAKARGFTVRTEKHLTAANGRCVVEEAERGFAKLVIDAETDELLGVQLMCPHAGEMIGGLAVAINSGLTARALSGTVFPHPTVSEIIT